jgi:hypothetical protein
MRTMGRTWLAAILVCVTAPLLTATSCATTSSNTREDDDIIAAPSRSPTGSGTGSGSGKTKPVLPDAWTGEVTYRYTGRGNDLTDWSSIQWNVSETTKWVLGELELAPKSFPGARDEYAGEASFTATGTRSHDFVNTSPYCDSGTELANQKVRQQVKGSGTVPVWIWPLTEDEQTGATLRLLTDYGGALPAAINHSSVTTRQTCGGESSTQTESTDRAVPQLRVEDFLLKDKYVYQGSWSKAQPEIPLPTDLASFRGYLPRLPHETGTATIEWTLIRLRGECRSEEVTAGMRSTAAEIGNLSSSLVEMFGRIRANVKGPVDFSGQHPEGTVGATSITTKGEVAITVDYEQIHSRMHLAYVIAHEFAHAEDILDVGFGPNEAASLLTEAEYIAYRWEMEAFAFDFGAKVLTEVAKKDPSFAGCVDRLREVDPNLGEMSAADRENSIVDSPGYAEKKLKADYANSKEVAATPDVKRAVDAFRRDGLMPPIVDRWTPHMNQKKQ